MGQLTCIASRVFMDLAAFALISAAAFAAPGTNACLPISVYDGFESDTLSNVWQTILLPPGALKIQSRIVRAGHGAAEITVHARDKFEPGINGNSDSERDELVEAKSLVARQEDNLRNP